MKRISGLLAAIMAVILTSCAARPASSASACMLLAEFSESYVNVSITLEVKEAGQAVLAATFTPTEPDGHLYSSGLPKEGIDGVGRPTRIELPTGAFMTVTGELEESIEAKNAVVVAGLPALPVYPSGPVTLRLPVQLPRGQGELVSDLVMVTYMACTPHTCHKPVFEKLVDVKVPSK